MTKTILVADDSKTIQMVVTLTFRATDFRVVTAADGEDALRKIAELRPDVVLADVAMPGKNGYELCSLLKSGAGTSAIPVLLLAGAFEPFDERRARDARADGHIKKPFDSQSLIDRVKQATGAPVASELPMSFAASLAARRRDEQGGGSSDPSPRTTDGLEAARQAAEAARQEQARAEAAKEQARAEAARQEQLRVEAARQEQLRAEAARQEQARLEAIRQEQLRAEAARQEQLRAEAARQEQLRAEAARQEQARLDAIRQEQLRAEAARQEQLRAEAARQEQLRAEAARQEQARAEMARQEQLRAETARQEQARSAAARPSPFGAPAGGAPVARAFAADLGMPQAARSTDAQRVPPPGAGAGSPFGPPRADAGRPGRSTPSASGGVVFEDPEIIEDGEIIEDYPEAPGGPTLEPPAPPSEAQRAAIKVDLWSLADAPAAAKAPRAPGTPEARAREAAAGSAGWPEGLGTREAPGDTQEIPEEDLERMSAAMKRGDREGPDGPAPSSARVAEGIAAAIAERSAGPIAAAVAPAAPGLPHDELVALAREVIERVAWEVVPDLAEVIIRSELRRLLDEDA